MRSILTNKLVGVICLLLGFNEIETKLGIPQILEIKGKWTPNDSEKKAAWELYVELVSRISVVKMEGDEGILREALDSLYSLFGSTREILRKYGPDVAPMKGVGEPSLGKIAVVVLNLLLRPLLTKWHPLLQEYEEQRKEGVTRKAHEENWALNKKMRLDVEEARKVLNAYSYELAKIAGVDPIHDEIESENDGVKKT